MARAKSDQKYEEFPKYPCTMLRRAGPAWSWTMQWISPDQDTHKGLGLVTLVLFKTVQKFPIIGTYRHQVRTGDSRGRANTYLPWAKP